MKNQKNNQPLVSIIMPVYNAGGFLVEAVNSILKQTYQNFEFIIVDDHSTDNSWKILQKLSMKSDKIKLLQNNENVGISKTLNYAITQAKGKYIVRMDADDITHTKRIKKQINYLMENKEVVAIGTQCYVINTENKIIGKKQFPTKAKQVHDYLFKFNPVQHPTLTIKRALLPKNFFYYDHGFDGAEDLNLIFKLQQYGKVENLNEYLHYYRIHDHNSSLRNIKNIFWKAFLSRMNGVLKFGYRPSITALITTFAQTLIVLALPENIIFKLYVHMRNLNKAKFKHPLASFLLNKTSLKTKVRYGLQ